MLTAACSSEMHVLISGNIPIALPLIVAICKHHIQALPLCVRPTLVRRCFPLLL